MQFKFYAHGHPNILATHKTTLEFTKEKELSLEGNCIVGIASDFELSEIKNFIKNCKNKKIKITIEAPNKKINDTIEAEINSDFNSGNEIVIRKTDFISERTLAIKSDKAAFELKRELIEFLKEKKNKIRIIVENRK